MAGLSGSLEMNWSASSRYSSSVASISPTWKKSGESFICMGDKG